MIKAEQRTETDDSHLSTETEIASNEGTPWLSSNIGAEAQENNPPLLTSESIRKILKGDTKIQKMWVARDARNQRAVDSELARRLAFYTLSESGGGLNQLAAMLKEAGRDEETVETLVAEADELSNSGLLNTWQPSSVETTKPILMPTLEGLIKEMDTKGLFTEDFGFQTKALFINAVMRTSNPVAVIEGLFLELDNAEKYPLLGIGTRSPNQKEFLKLLQDTGVVRKVRKERPKDGFLKLSNNGLPIGSRANVQAILDNDEKLEDIVAYNELTGEYELSDTMPDFLRAKCEGNSRQLRDEHVTAIGIYMENVYEVNAPSPLIYEVLSSNGIERRYHPIRNYLKRLRWDGVERVETWLHHYAKTADTEYERFVGKSVLISAVARVMNPGCQVDTMLVLEGPKGIRKSTVVRVLSNGWYKDDPLNIQNMNGSLFMGLKGAWLYEIPEMHWSKSEASAIKAFLTKPQDNYKKPYGRAFITVPRSNIFIGTVNPGSNTFNDSTPERRYLPVAVNDYIDIDKLTEDRDQLWAEAVMMYRRGDKWHWEHDSKLARIIEEEQAVRFDPDTLNGAVHKWLYETYRGEVSIMEVIEGISGDSFNPMKVMRSEQTRVGIILGGFGWTKKRTSVGSGRRYVYARPASKFITLARGIAMNTSTVDEFWEKTTEACRNDDSLRKELDKFDELAKELNSLPDYLRFL